MLKSFRVVAAFVASLALAFVPTAAQAVVEDPTTVDATVGGVAPTSMQQDDQIDVVTRGPIAQIGSSIHTLSTTWSTQSLHLLGTGKYNADSNPNGIIVPQGWSLQYSTDGTTWLDDAPGDINTIVAVRSRGDVTTKARGRFETTSTGEEVATSTGFDGASGGDGFNIAFGDGFLLNSWHHDSSYTVECHLVTGETCPEYTHTVSGYQTQNTADLYFDKSTNRAYEIVRQSSSGDPGVYCLDYTNVLTSAPVNCPTPFVALANWATGGGFNQSGSPSARDGNKIYMVDVYNGTLLCFDMSTNDVCSSNGFSIGSAGVASDANWKARVAAGGGKIFFTVNDTMGCFDPATTTLCGNPDSTPVSLPTASGASESTKVRHKPLAVYNTDGSFRGVCDELSRICLDANGANTTMPSGLDAYFTANPPYNTVGGAGYNEWSQTGTKLYLSGPSDPTNPANYSGNLWASTIDCWDFATDALCSGYSTANQEGVYQPYNTNIDPDNPGCVWVNQDKNWSPVAHPYTIKMIPLNARTGEVGCSLGDPVIELPYSSVVPRMACEGDGRVTAWQELLLNLGSVDNNDLAVTIYDSSGDTITGWEDLTPDSDGIIDLSTLAVADTGLTPSIQITGLNDLTMDDLIAVTGTVTFDADEPEMCLSLVAETNCPDAEMNVPGVPDVPAGIIEGASVTTPLAAGSDVGSNERITIAGTDSGHLCAASIVGDATKTPELASTGFDPSGLAFGGFGILAAGLGAIEVSRRRKITAN